MMEPEGKRTKKRNFTQSEVVILIDDVDTRKKILFGGHSVGITNARKTTEWQYVADAVNNVASEGRTVSEIKKWSDIKVEAKRRISLHRRSVCATGGGQGTAELTPTDKRLAGIIVESLLSGVVTEAEEGDTDAPEPPDEGCCILLFEM